MLYHREAVLPVGPEPIAHCYEDAGNIEVENKERNTDEYLGDMLSVRKKIKAGAMSQIKQTQQYQKQYYDRRHSCQEVCKCVSSRHDVTRKSTFL